MGDHVQSANLKDYFGGSTVLGNTPTVDGRIIQTPVDSLNPHPPNFNVIGAFKTWPRMDAINQTPED